MITVQYASLIAASNFTTDIYSRTMGNKLLDKIRYFQACMCQKISFVHRFEELMFC
jgi:putative transposase